MLTLAIKLLIILLAIVNSSFIFDNTLTIIFLLFAISATSLSQYYNTRQLTFAITGSYTLISLFQPTALVFLPVFFFDLATHLPYKHAIFLTIVFIFANDGNLQTTFFRILLSLVALLLSNMSMKISDLHSINKQVRDANMSQKITLKFKNQELLQRQNDEIHLIKLKERNRIARDIHDTIGHSLSRALLQIGALRALNQNKTMQPIIDGLKETLTKSMDAIRNSIHDLKDDSVDLKSAVSQILAESGFKTSFNYDIDKAAPNIVKNCFLIILKESITNVRKHSNANQISVTITEHPAIYQFLIADNGTKEPAELGHGIGLQNIHERINELNGYCRMSYQVGFRIFITIPKKDATRKISI